jgi:hypothetical protein
MELFSLHDSEIHLISCRHNSRGMTMVTSTINMVQRIQNYNTNKLQVFRIHLLIPNGKDFFIFVQLCSLISRVNMSLLWTQIICVQEWGHGRTLPKSSSYIIYTQIIMPKEGMKPNVPCSVLKGHSQQDWACRHTIYKTQFKGLLGYWQKDNLNLNVVTKRPSLTQAASWVKHFDS